MSTDTDYRRPATGTTRAGWYQDPAHPDGLRWWTGSTWTEFTAPNPRARSTAPPQAWYPDPKDPTQRLRWWDGHHWTGKTRDRYPGWPWMLVLLATLLMIYLYFESLSLY